MTATLLHRPPSPRQHPTRWWDLAACRDRDPDWWITAGETRAISGNNKRALAICRACPVQRPCLDEAVTRHDVGVIRGGMRMPAWLQGWTDPNKQPERIRRLLRWRAAQEAVHKGAT